MDKKILIGLGFVVVIAILVFVLIKVVFPPTVDKLNIDLKDKDHIVKGNEVIFRAAQHGKVNVNSVKWDFGDSTLPSTLMLATHTYFTVGSHLVRLYVDGKVSDSTTIYVQPLIQPVIPSDIKIEGPKTATVGQKVTFTDVTPGAKEFHWKSGETGREDGTAKSFSYAFASPGAHTVTVTDNTTKSQGRYDVIVSSPYAPPPPKKPDNGGQKPPPPPQPAPPPISDDKIKIGLQNLVSEGSDRYPVIYGELKNILCGNDKIPVTINGGKTMDFNSYTNKIINEEAKILTLKTTRDPESHCITNIAVTQ